MRETQNCFISVDGAVVFSATTMQNTKDKPPTVQPLWAGLTVLLVEDEPDRLCRKNWLVGKAR